MAYISHLDVVDLVNQLVQVLQFHLALALQLTVPLINRCIACLDGLIISESDSRARDI